MVSDRKNFIDLLLKMFNYSPSKRITAAEALKHPFFDSIHKEDFEPKESKNHLENDTEVNSAN